MNRQNQTVYELPGISVSWVSDATIQMLGGVVILRYDFHKNDQDFRSAILFDEPICYRYRYVDGASLYSVEEAYDRLIEITNSSWLREQMSEMHPRHLEDLEAHHYMIFLESFGSFEALAAGFRTMEVESGNWRGLYNSRQSELSAMVINKENSGGRAS